MRIYVSGPMTGLPEHNLPAFAAAALELGALGYDAVDPGRNGADSALSWSDYLRRDLADLVTCEAVAVLDGWEKSRGARLEVHVAEELGMPVHSVREWIRRGGER